MKYIISVKREGKVNKVSLMVDDIQLEGNVIPIPKSRINQVAVQVIL